MSYRNGDHKLGLWKDHEIYNAYPSLSSFYSDYEKNWEMDKGMEQIKKMAKGPLFVICFLYLLMCYIGPKIMKSRKPYNLNKALFVWNSTLAVFSTVGALRTVPHLFRIIYLYGFKYSLVAPGSDWLGGGAIGLWIQLFIFSKIPELGDTVFIILRKKPLIFLHWYHHVTVLLYCWHSYVNEEAYGVLFAAMNYTVHAVMYLYYALATMKIRLCKPYYITFLQISQMFIGIGVCCACWIYFGQEKNSDEHKKNLWAGIVMYASYAFLFLKYAIHRFIKNFFKSNQKGEKAVEIQNAGKKVDECYLIKKSETFSNGMDYSNVAPKYE